MAEQAGEAAGEAQEPGILLALRVSDYVLIAFERQDARVLLRATDARYQESMKSNTAGKSSFTLAPAEHAQVLRLKRMLKARSNAEVIRRSLAMLEESLSRDELRRQFREAAERVRASTREVIEEWDPLVGEGLEDA